MNHFDEMTALLYLEAQLDAEHARDISAHAAACVACRELLQALETEGVWLRESLAADEEAVPARLIKEPERHVPWGWISAFGLSVGGAYTVWNGFIEPWRAQAAQAGFTQGNLFTMLFFSGAFWKGWDAMRSLMEFLAVATLGVVVMWLLRRRWRRFPTIAAVLGAMICSLAISPILSAGETKNGNPNYSLEAGEEVKTDLFVFADRTQINGDVDGDLIVWSRNVTVTGHVHGDVLCFSQELRVNGPVDGNVRAFAQSVTVNNKVGKNVMVWAGELDLSEGSAVGGTVTMGAGNGELNGEVAGDMLGLVGDLDVNGKFGGNMEIRGGGNLTIGPKADIKGRLRAEVAAQPTISPEAKLGSAPEITINKKHGHERNYSSLSFYWHQTLLWGASFVFGLVLILLAPGFFFDVERACRKTGQAMGFGLLFLFATPIAAIIVCITIVGLGVGIATFLLYLIAIYSAQVFVGAWAGERILGEAAGVGAALGRLALGLVILRAIGMLPYVGSWISFLVVAWGMGAMVLALYRYMRPQLVTAA